MSLESIARNKLSLSSSSNLHRWVLLKNSILASPPRDEPPTPPAAFMFPTSYSYPHPHDDPHARSSEALWLDTLLQSLAHDDDDDDEPPIEDELDDDDPEDPDLLSPMSSSDDLPFIRYYPRRSPLAPLPIQLPFPFSDLDVLDDSIDFSSDDGDPDSDPLKCSSCSSSSSSTSPSSSASSLPPSTPPSSPLRSWAPVPNFPLPPLPPSPALYIDAYSDPLPFSHTFTYTPFVFHPC